jgi:lipoprotein-releasing system permease protein
MKHINYHLIFIAFRQLINRKRQAILTIAGIGVAVMVLITAISLMDGLLQSFIQKIVDIAPHIVVNGEKVNPLIPDRLVEADSLTTVNFIKNVDREDEEVIKNYKKITETIQSDSLVETVSPVVSINSIGVFGTITQPVQLFGVIPAKEDKISKLSQSMIQGHFSELEKTPDGVLLGESAAEDFTIETGDRMQIISVNDKIYTVRVVGVFSTGINDIDGNIYANMKLVQNIGGYPPDQVTSLYLRVTNLPKDAIVARTIEKETNYKAVTWEEKAASVISLFKMISMIVYFLVFFVILVAGFGVANVLITSVLEKTRDIAVMKSMGFKRSEVTWIYFLEGMFVAIIGAAIGCLLGYIMIQILSSIPVAASKTSTISSDRLMMGKSIWYFVLASLFALVVSVIASISPSRKAANINPIEILRGER